MYRVFEDRRSAGRALVPELQRCELKDPIILGLPRGGVPLAFEIAAALHAPLDTIVVRKLGVPSQPELAFGAIASGGIRVINDDVVESLFSLDEDTIDSIAKRVGTMAKRIGLSRNVAFVGGGAKNIGLRHALEKIMGIIREIIGILKEAKVKLDTHLAFRVQVIHMNIGFAEYFFGPWRGKNLRR